MARLTRAAIRAFVQRDRAGVDDAKQEFWLGRKRALGPAEGIRIANALREQVIAQHPGWPSPEERAADLATHERVSAALRRVRLSPAFEALLATARPTRPKAKKK